MSLIRDNYGALEHDQRQFRALTRAGFERILVCSEVDSSIFRKDFCVIESLIGDNFERKNVRTMVQKYL